MDTAVMEAHLLRAVSCLGSEDSPAVLQDVVSELRWCEKELVMHRFVRSTRADGSVRRVRNAGVDAALIHVSRALALVGVDTTQLPEARASIENARAELAHLSA